MDSPGTPSDPPAPVPPDVASGAPEIPPAAAPAPASVDRYFERRARIEREFAELQSAVKIYAAIVLPLLGMFAGARYFPENLPAIELWGEAIFYLTLLVIALHSRRSIAHLFRWPVQAGWRIWLLVGATPIVTVAAALGLSAAMRAVGFPIVDVADDPALERWGPGGALISFAVLPAIFEEIAFRGVLLTRFQRVMSPVQAIWVTSILFGAVHFNVFGMAIFIVPIGLLAAWLVGRTQSLWPGIVLHFTHNAIVATLALTGLIV